MVENTVDIRKRVENAPISPGTLEPFTELVHSRVDIAGKKVEVIPMLYEGASEAQLSEGDLEKNDQIVRETPSDLMSENDVIVLTQASMVRVTDTIPEKDKKAPILSSPKLAMDHLNELILSMM
jgi:hypothetical protein